MPPLSTAALRESYLKFFESKGHVRIPSAPLVPENDPSVLFTTAGMHPLVPYLKGRAHPAGKRLVDAQKCLRTTDIDDVGDATHATVFEMLGNWSLGDYFKQEAITWSYEFLTARAWLGIDPHNLAITIFAGDSDAPLDTEAYEAWRSLGIPEEKIARLGKEDNWWPAGGKHPGPQGPDTEMFFWSAAKTPPVTFDPSDKRWVEIWNDVFMQYNRTAAGAYEPLPQQNVDTGMGLERAVMILNGLASIYEIDTYQPLMKLIDDLSQKHDETQQRILADHIKAFTFVLGDEIPVIPSNADQGYVARRLIRTAVLALRKLHILADVSDFLIKGRKLVIQEYEKTYPVLTSRDLEATNILQEEVHKFDKALKQGLPQIIENETSGMTGHYAFGISSTYAVRKELIEEYALEHGVKLDPNFKSDFDKAQREHQEKSRAAAAGKFKGGLADHSEKSIHYHTATHLLHQALRTILGDHVFQRGSNITPERLRFDFSHPQKMTPGQIAAVEKLVNEQIKADLTVTRQHMSIAEAKKSGALGLFEHKYGETISVYAIGDFSREICGGPHAEHTGVLGTFKIVKEEAASAGVRRIKAVLT